jgi:D-amino-acid dehydrogenase
MMDSRTPDHGAPTGRSHADLIVIGGGAIGVASAVEAAGAGATVILIDREPALGSECSGSAAGLINRTHLAPLANPSSLRDGVRWMWRPDSPFHLRPRPALLPWLARFTTAALNSRRVAAGSKLLHALGRDSVRLHREFADHGMGTGLVTNGILYACETEAGLAELRRQMQAVEPYHIGYRILDAAEARDLEPALSDVIVGAGYCEGEAHLDPASFVRALATRAARIGVDIRTSTEVTAIHAVHGRITRLDTTRGPVTGETVVLAAGAWSGRLARQLGLHLPLQAAKGYYIDHPAHPTDPRHPIYLHERRVVATPLGDRLRLAGTLELGSTDDGTDPVRTNALIRAAAQALGSFRDRPAITTWRGLRPATPDGLPMLGRSSTVDNLIIATGHGMTGIVLAPITAKIVTALWAGSPTGYDLNLTRPDRFRSVRLPCAARK